MNQEMELDEVSKKVAAIPLEGNLIPHNWFNVIKLHNGKPDIVAMVILSEIVFWYRPTAVKDEDTGAFLGYRKKYRADKLQRSYDKFSDQFGLSKKQIREAFKRLEDIGVIERDFRDMKVKGKHLSSVLFIGLFPDKLLEISFPETSRGGSLKGREGVPFREGGAFPPGQPVYIDHYTEITIQVLSYLNEQAGKNFKSSNAKTKKHIHARLNEGFELDDFKRVIDNKVGDWAEDLKMNKYLRPETLFGTKFESYLNEQPVKDSSQPSLYDLADQLDKEDE